MLLETKKTDSKAGSTNAMRLLVVEDDREAAAYLRKALREAGHICEIAYDGEEGFALALDGEFDVFVIDRMLPKRDGLSLVSDVRKRGVRTPVLIPHPPKASSLLGPENSLAAKEPAGLGNSKSRA